MKKLLFGTILLALVGFPIVTMAGVDVNIGISIPLPPLITFEAPPDVVVLPDTNGGVYVVPGINVDLFFWNGFWWRPWEGRWYRSPYYDRGWVYYDRVPRFYYNVDPYWRSHYQNHNWHGHIWNYQPIPHSQLQQNWKGWQSSRYWEKKKTWGVQGYAPKPQQQVRVLRQQRQTLYQQKPEVQQHQEFLRQQRQAQPQRRGESHQQFQGHEGHGEEHRR